MTEDAQQLGRTAQYLVIEARRGYGSPPNYSPVWEPVWGAKVDRIEINRDSSPSAATIWFPELRWQQAYNLAWGDMIRIRTNEPSAADRTIVFAGFITTYLSNFSGGTEQKGSAFERNAIVCLDHRWLLSTTSPIFGQIARGPDDYTNYGQVGQSANYDSYIFLSGRRAIFNADGKPNSDPDFLTLKSSSGSTLCEIPIFADTSNLDDTNIAIPWTARDMLRYVLSPFWNQAYQYLPIADPNELAGIDHGDWDKVLSHIVVEGLNAIDAIQLICRHIGWGFREDYGNDGSITFRFYKIAAASQYSRSNQNTTILHLLHAPAVGENIDTAVAEGKKILWAMDLAEDIATVINNPWGLGSPHRFEFTAELVPAWEDKDLAPDTSDDNANLFFTESDLQEMTDPDSKSYYNYYHPRGSKFRRNIGRKWALNESGRYSKSSSYDRGMPFDFANIVPKEYILDKRGKRVFAPFRRQLLPCLTIDKDSLNSVGIKVEFSFDGGNEWQVIPAAITPLKDECGIYIDEANLAELVDKAEWDIEGGVLDGVQLNYWSSLCDDILSSASFKDGEWQTRVRVTASVQLDQRLRYYVKPSSASCSPFHQSQIYNFSEKYGLAKRTASSVFSKTSLPVWDVDNSGWLGTQLNAIRSANEDMSISGQFTLERLWLGYFAIGDCIEKITGREYNLSAAFGSRQVYPEIIQIIYMPDKQKMKLITRDLRFAEVLL